jgi:hypothetical protein
MAEYAAQHLYRLSFVKNMFGLTANEQMLFIARHVEGGVH